MSETVVEQSVVGLSDDVQDLIALALDLGLSAEDLRQAGYAYFEAAHWLSLKDRKSTGECNE